MADQRSQQPAAQAAYHWRHVLRRANEHMLFAEDIGPKGTSTAAEIVGAEVITVKTRGGSEAMVAVSFKGKKKKLGLNRTNCKVLETLCGTPDYTRWRGWVTLIVIRTRAPDRDSGEMIETDAIRIAAQRPAGDRSRAGSDRGAPDAEEAAEIARREREGST